MLEKCKKSYFSGKTLRLEWGGMVAISFLMLISFFYLDTKSLTVWSVNLLDAIADGEIWDYYSYCYINEYGAASKAFAGPYIVLIPWAIWNIPIWLIQKYAGIAIISNAFMMIWSKLFLVVVESIMLFYAHKITMFLTGDKDKAWWVVFLSASFPFTLIGVYYSGQSDIIVLAYATIAIYYLLKNRYVLFLFFSALAIVSKPFFLFAFVVLILYTEKNIIKVFIKFLLGCSFSIIFQIIYGNAPMFKESYDLTPAGENMDMLTRTSFGRVLGTNGSWFFLLFIILCVVAYIKRTTNDEQKKYFIIYFTTAAMLLVLGFTSIQHYRPIYLVPFLFILFMLNDTWYRINMILKTCYSIATLLAICCMSDKIFSKASMEHTLISRFIPMSQRGYICVREFIEKNIKDFEVYHKILATISVACIVVMLVINYPLLKAKPEIECEKCERWVMWIDVLMMAGILLIVFKMFLII